MEPREARMNKMQFNDTSSPLSTETHLRRAEETEFPTGGPRPAPLRGFSPAALAASKKNFGTIEGQCYNPCLF